MSSLQRVTRSTKRAQSESIPSSEFAEGDQFSLDIEKENVLPKKKQSTKSSTKSTSQKISKDDETILKKTDELEKENVEQETGLSKKKQSTKSKNVQQKISRDEKEILKKTEELEKENKAMRRTLQNYEIAKNKTFEMDKKNIVLFDDEQEVSAANDDEDNETYDEEFVEECLKLQKEINEIKMENLHMKILLERAGVDGSEE